jgi:hypothetical protein
VRISPIERHIKRKSKIMKVILRKNITVIERKFRNIFVKKTADRKIDGEMTIER